MTQKRTHLAALAALLLAVCLLVGLYAALRPRPQSGGKDFSVTVTHGDGAQSIFSFRSEEEYLGPFLQEEGLIEGESGPFGLYITMVDGESALYETDGSYWAFYQNGEYAAQGADLTPIADGDTFSFVYTAG